MSSSSFSTVLLLFAATQANVSAPRHFRLPPAAVVRLGPRSANSSDPEASICSSSLHFTPLQVVRMFRTYHLLLPGEMHSRYDTAPCWQDGTIIFEGRTFIFRHSPLRTLTTTFPDGKEKQLGGRSSDRLSGR
jgi:hypothetical protein